MINKKLSSTSDLWWEKYQKDILHTGLDTECGTVVGLSEGLLEYKSINGKLIPVRTNKEGTLPKEAYEACASKYCNYPELNKFVFGEMPRNWLCGVTKSAFIGHASNEQIRRTGASGGILSAVLIHLLNTNKISGVICLKMDEHKPWKAVPHIAKTKEQIIASAGSVYSATPTNTILKSLKNEEGHLAYIGLPDQVAAIRKLQKMEHPTVKNIKYVFGPYTGTQMSFEAIKSFLRSHNIKNEEDISSLKYRAGEWPGHLEIQLKDGKTLKAEKFHYNYLIPFFITSSSLQVPDFTNELTDLSVGDAWSPALEKQRGGYSVILARKPETKNLLLNMQKQDLLTLKQISIEEALNMHGHMLDFKKRGSFIRNSWKKVSPEYGYRPVGITKGRITIEWCLWAFFFIGKQRFSRWIIEHLPISIIGPAFNTLRKGWKYISKPTKRKGLRNQEFTVL